MTHTDAVARVLSLSFAGLAGVAACGVCNAESVVVTGNATNGVLSFDAASYAALCPDGGCWIIGWDGDEDPDRNTF